MVTMKPRTVSAASPSCLTWGGGRAWGRVPSEEPQGRDGHWRDPSSCVASGPWCRRGQLCALGSPSSPKGRRCWNSQERLGTLAEVSHWAPLGHGTALWYKGGLPRGGGHRGRVPTDSSVAFAQTAVSQGVLPRDPTPEQETISWGQGGPRRARGTATPSTGSGTGTPLPWLTAGCAHWGGHGLAGFSRLCRVTSCDSGDLAADGQEEPTALVLRAPARCLTGCGGEACSTPTKENRLGSDTELSGL